MASLAKLVLLIVQPARLAALVKHARLDLLSVLLELYVTYLTKFALKMSLDA